MNFYSHVAVASLFSNDAALALGSMLPDFASLIGAKPPQTDCPRINRGYALHHATDRAFHDSDTFRQDCAAESQLLRSLGLSRGTAVAAAHVALELILDDALSDDQPSLSLFRDALAAAAPECGSPQTLHWATPDQAARFETLRQRLCGLSVPRQTSAPATLAERLCRTLSNRPRLAVRASDRASIDSWVVELAERCGPTWPGLIAVVVGDLERASWRVGPRRASELRFRRAQDGQV